MGNAKDLDGLPKESGHLPRMIQTEEAVLVQGHHVRHVGEGQESEMEVRTLHSSKESREELEVLGVEAAVVDLVAAREARSDLAASGARYICRARAAAASRLQPTGRRAIA